MSYNLALYSEEKTIVRKPLLILLIITMILPYEIANIQVQPVISIFLFTYIILKILTNDIKVQLSYSYLLSIFLLITLYSGLVSLIYFSSDNIIKLISGFHNHIFLFLVMLVLASTSINKINLSGEINFIGKLIVLVIIINFITQLMQIVFPCYANEILWFFNSSVTNNKPTFEFSQELGRYSGILNVSVVAGYFSIISFIFLIYQFSNRSLLYKLSLFIIFFSGFLTLSKIFILGFILSIIILCFYKQVQVMVFIFLVGIVGLILLVVLSDNHYITKFISYFNFIFNIGFDKQLSLRYGASSHNSILFSALSTVNLLFGQGFPVMDSIDSGLLWYTLQGGLVALSLVGLFFLIWFLQIKKNKCRHNQVFILLCYLITLVTFLADPINIMRRSTILFALVVYYTVHLSRNDQNSANLLLLELK